MKWYFYLNYCVYRFYNRKKDEIPVFTAFLVTIILIYSNIFTVWTIYEFIYDFWTIPSLSNHYKADIILELSFLGLINYWLLYRKKKYEDVFEEFRRNYDRYKKWNKSVKLYIILTIVMTILVLVIADVRNQHVQKYSSEKAAAAIRSNPGSGFIRLSGFAHETGLRQSVGLSANTGAEYGPSTWYGDDDNKWFK